MIDKDTLYQLKNMATVEKHWDIDRCIWIERHVDLNVFAEYIITVCMNVCDGVENDEELSDYDGSFRDGALMCYEGIKNHFGVK